MDSGTKTVNEVHFKVRVRFFLSSDMSPLVMLVIV